MWTKHKIYFNKSFIHSSALSQTVGDHDDSLLDITLNNFISKKHTYRQKPQPNGEFEWGFCTLPSLARPQPQSSANGARGGPPPLITSFSSRWTLTSVPTALRCTACGSAENCFSVICSVAFKIISGCMLLAEFFENICSLYPSGYFKLHRWSYIYRKDYTSSGSYCLQRS